MPQDRRTRKFKRDRQERLDDPTPLGVPITPEDQIPEAQDHIVTPENCIWCGFPLHKKKAICPNCKNCQSCGLLQSAGGMEQCYLCGNRVPEKRVPEAIPNFQRIRGQKGFHKNRRENARKWSGKGRIRKP